MLKKSSVLSYVLAIFLVFLMAVPFIAESYNGDSNKEIYTSYCEDNYIYMEIQGRGLIVSGVLSTGFEKKFWILINIGDIKETIKITPKEYFSKSIKLRDITKKTAMNLFSNGSK